MASETTYTCDLCKKKIERDNLGYLFVDSDCNHHSYHICKSHLPKKEDERDNKKRTIFDIVKNVLQLD